MPVRHDFVCKDGHEFTLWTDDARLCPVCGCEYLKKIFIEPPMINKKAKGIDALIKNELDARGITNIKSDGREGDTAKVTYKTAPETLAAAKIERDFPQMQDKDGLAIAKKQIVDKYSSIGVKGLINAGVPGSDVLKSAIPVGTRNVNGRNIIMPSAEPNAFKVNDAKMVQRNFRKDPDNLQVKR